EVAAASVTALTTRPSRRHERALITRSSSRRWGSRAPAARVARAPLGIGGRSREDRGREPPTRDDRARSTARQPRGRLWASGQAMAGGVAGPRERRGRPPG